jgi:predicted  nucleic acid-binding Zn-ribbon protein
MDKDTEIYYWKDKYLTLKEEYDKLQEQYRELDRKLDKANYQIKTELEPRIQREKRAYDTWVTNQGVI